MRMTPTKKNNILVRGFQVAAVSVAILAAHPSSAAIIGGQTTVGRITLSGEILDSTTGNVTVLDPPPSLIEEDGFESLNVLAFNEKQSHILSQDIIAYEEFFGSEGPIGEVIIPAETRLSSHFVFVDPPEPQTAGPRRYVWSGQITFDEEIKGIIGRGFSQTDKLLGLEDTSYRMGGGNGLDQRTAENFRDVVSFNKNILSFRITAVPYGMDSVRVITGKNSTPPAPEPLTILGSGVALGFGVLFQKMKRDQGN